MGWDKGFNFRDTEPYVTDGANETHVIDENDLYPQTRNGVTFGVLVDEFNVGRDKDNTLDRRLAGTRVAKLVYPSATFQVDLPAVGAYEIHIACGSADASLSRAYVRLSDDITQLALLVNDQNVTLGSFRDATGTEYTAANWPDNETGVQYTFSTTTLKLDVYKGAGGTSNEIAHLRVLQAATSGLTHLRRRRYFPENRRRLTCG